MSKERDKAESMVEKRKVSVDKYKQRYRWEPCEVTRKARKNAKRGLSRARRRVDNAVLREDVGEE